MLNETGGVIDDLIVYFLSASEFRLVVNAGTRDKDLGWIRRYAQDFGVQVRERADLAMLAVQGPQARQAGVTLLASADAAARAQPAGVRRRVLRGLVHRAHRLHRRGRLRDHAAAPSRPCRHGLR